MAGLGDPKWDKLNKGFVRGASNFQNWITPDTDFPPERGRYHLYVNYTCGWCHRVLMVHALKQLDGIVSWSLTSNKMIRGPGGIGGEGYKGWAFNDQHPDPINGATCTLEVYRQNNPEYPNKQLSVPILFDRKRNVVVSNDNIQICFILNSAFASLAPPTPDLYPEKLQDAIEAQNEYIYPNINNGVYRVGMGKAENRAEALADLFGALEQVEAVVSRQPFLCGDDLTLADVRAFPHLFRFDTCYYTAFGCSTRTLASHPGLSAYVRRLYEHPGVAQTCDLWMACLGYHGGGVGKPENEAAAAAAYAKLKHDYIVETKPAA